MIKKFFQSPLTQIILGLIIASISIAAFYILAIIFIINYSGFALPFLPGIPGSGLAWHLALAILFGLLIFIFPILVWIFIYKLGNLKTLKKWVKILTFLIFAFLPFLIYFGFYLWDVLKRSFLY